jgi:heme exporter protein B
MHTFSLSILRDIRLALRRRSDVFSTLFFFIIVASLFPLAIGPEQKTLLVIAPGIVWVAALLASMLLPQPLYLTVLAKSIAHWLISGLPLSLMSLLLALQYHLPIDSTIVLLISLLIGTPVLSLTGAIGAALTLGLKGGSVLLSLLVLPLYVPLLIFGAGSVDAYAAGLGVEAHLSILGACLALALVFCPLAATAALRISMD